MPPCSCPLQYRFGFHANALIDGLPLPANKNWYRCSSTYYDAWNPMAREQFYQYCKEAMFDIGVACLWMDATEPENFPNVNAQAYLGTGNALFNRLGLWVGRCCG